MDLLKNQYGFKVQHVTNTELGTVGSPTNVFILMTKITKSCSLVKKREPKGPTGR